MKAEATCKTYLQPLIASSQPLSSLRFNSQKSKFSFELTSFSIASLTKLVYDKSRKDPPTEYPLFNNSAAQ